MTADQPGADLPEWIEHSEPVYLTLTSVETNVVAHVAEAEADQPATPAIKRHIIAEGRLSSPIRRVKEGSPIETVRVALQPEDEVAGPEHGGALWFFDERWQLNLGMPVQSFDLIWNEAVKVDATTLLAAEIALFKQRGGLSAGRAKWSHHSHNASFKSVQITHGGGQQRKVDPIAFKQAATEQVEKIIAAARTATAAQCWQYRTFLGVLTETAANSAAAAGMSIEDFKSGPLQEAVAIVDNLAAAMTGDRDTPGEDFWRVSRNVLMDAKSGKRCPIDRSELELVAGRYLKTPFRSSHVERCLVNGLIVVELADFGAQMLDKKSFGAPSPLYRWVIRPWLLGQFVNVLILGGIAALAIYSAQWGWLGSGWALGIAAVAVGLAALALAVSVIALPFALYGRHRDRAKVMQQLSAMNFACVAAQGDGPVSARHVRAMVDRASALDVLWPAALHAVLDDIVERGGRF